MVDGKERRVRGVEGNNSSSDVQHQKKGIFCNGASGINRVCG